MAYLSQWKPSTILLGIVLQCLLVSAQSGDGGDVSGFSNSNLGAAGTGAEGSSNSSANLSKGAIIAIAVVVAVVVVGGITLAVLFYLAKKRQWQVRATIRRTATKAVRAMTPRTPAKMSFGPRSPRAEKQSHTFAGKKKSSNDARDTQDLEKGFTSIETRLGRQSDETTNSKSKSPERLLKAGPGQGLTLQVPGSKPTKPVSQFDMEYPKSPMWQRVLGRM